MDINYFSDRFIKHNLAHSFFDMLASTYPLLVMLLFIFLLDKTEMDQNDSIFVFVRKTSNLRTGMNQVTNMKPLSFTWKKEHVYWESFCLVLQIYKWLHYLFCGIVTIHDSFYKRDALATGCLYWLNKLTAWKVCVAFLPSISLASKSK